MTLKPDFDFLPLIALIAGLLTAAPALIALLAPGPAERLFKKFPRSIWPGRILALACLVWVALWLVVMPLGFLSVLQDYLWLLLPVAAIAVFVFTPELLACRAFGGLLALVPTPMLSAAQWHPSPARYLVICYAYLLAVAGMFYIALPYLMRDHIMWAFRTTTRPRAVAALFLALGATLAILSQTVY